MTTFVVLLITVISTIRGREESVILKHRFATGLVYKSLTVVSLAIGLIFVDSWIIAALKPDVSMLDAVFEAVSAFGTVCLSANVTPQLDWISKLLLCFTMFVGRVGPISFGSVSYTHLATQSYANCQHLPDQQSLSGTYSYLCGRILAVWLCQQKIPPY